MSFGSLKKLFKRNSRAMKQDHDMAVLMGSLGVSPKHANMYFDSVKKIREQEWDVDQTVDRILKKYLNEE